MKADAEEKSDETNAVIGNENLIASFVVWFNCLGLFHMILKYTTFRAELTTIRYYNTRSKFKYRPRGISSHNTRCSELQMVNVYYKELNKVILIIFPYE
jgi:hypothetical protein